MLRESCRHRIACTPAATSPDQELGHRLAGGLRGRSGSHMSSIRRQLNRISAWALGLGLLLTVGTGCAVPQRPGKGLCKRHVEPTTDTGYWLYLPEGYVSGNGQRGPNDRWPVILTLHGLRPYDDANPQIREWQQEADRYDFIVIAPELRTCDTLRMVPPLNNPNLPSLQQDERAIIAVLDEVERRTNADPSRVLATSFSSGGYLAHYMVNRHPERFTCLVVRGSNFSEELLDPAQVPKYRQMRIGIFFGENDFKLCREESMRAVEWYRRHHFDVVARKVGGLGHERKPEVAAALFASSIGASPKSAPDLGAVVMQDMAPAAQPIRRDPHDTSPGVYVTTPGVYVDRTPVEPAPTRSVVFSPPPAAKPAAQPAPTQPPVPVPQARPATPPPVVRTPSPVRVAPRQEPTPKRPTPAPQGVRGTRTASPRSEVRSRPTILAVREQIAPAAPPIGIEVHGDTGGQAPLWVSLSLNLPEALKEGATVTWTDNGKPIVGAARFDAQASLETVGEHRIEAVVLAADDVKYTARKTLTLSVPSSQPAGS